MPGAQTPDSRARMSGTTRADAIAWLVTLPHETRTTKATIERYGVPQRTAERWVGDANRQIREAAKESVAITLKTYKGEYEAAQALANDALDAASQALKPDIEHIRASANNGGKVDGELIDDVLRRAKAIYDLAEKSTGADLAKKAAIKALEGKSGVGGAGLPNLDDLFEVAGEVVSASPAENPGETIDSSSDSGPAKS